MLLQEIKSVNNRRPKNRVGRGGKRGTTSGKGQKGQKSRSGHRIRPAERDLIQRLPKLRGYRNKSLQKKLPVINVGDLESFKFDRRVKILGEGEVKKPFHIVNLPVSKSAKAKIEAVGGSVK